MIAVLLPLLAQTAAAPEMKIDCENAMTQQDMNICAHQEFQQADTALNAQWSVTAAHMRERDANLADYADDGRPGYFETLLAAQRAWLLFRDTHCKVEGYLARGGSMEPMLVSGCKTTLTTARAQQLRELSEYPY